MCHDEACIHSLKEEQMCWLIPGVEMGAMPTKSDTEEADTEVSVGCLRLDGEIGKCTRKEMTNYIRAKHNGENPLIPHHSSIWMHAGKGNHQEGSWTGDDAHMHFELLMDQFDILFNLVHEVPDPRLARANDILSVTDLQRKQFMYGLAIQIDRSQGHMKRDPESHNTKNGDGMKVGVKGNQPHFRHAFSNQFPNGCTCAHWTQCRRALCKQDCSICAKAVREHGSNPHFQSVGYKGVDCVLTERGMSIKGIKRDEKCEMLDSEPDWGVTKSAIAEILETRGHFGLVGAACHAELAYKEHGWTRVKLMVKPEVTGSMTKLEELVMLAIKKIGQRARLGDARKCREVMAAYRNIAERGEEVTAERLNLWEKIHKRHRGVHNTEITDLLLAAGMTVEKRSEATIKKLKSQDANDEYRKKEMNEFNYKLKNKIRRRNRAGKYDDEAKRKAKLRKPAYRVNHAIDQVKRKRSNLIKKPK